MKKEIDTIIKNAKKLAKTKTENELLGMIGKEMTKIKFQDMNDLANLMVFLSSSKVEYQTWVGSEFIDEESVKLGAVLSISIRGAAHMNFDNKGNLVGSSTDCAKSHRRKK